MNIKQVVLSFLAIFIISFIVLYPVFHIGLYGDDWLAIFRYVVHVSSSSKEGWNLFTYFLTPYGSQDIIMGLLYQSFGTNAFYYEITSYIFRLLAAFSLYPLVFYFTKSKIATFFAVLFSALTTTGFDSTGWLLTMPTYLTIAFFNIFLYFYILFHDTNKFKFLFILIIFFYLAYTTASARMIGAPVFILSLEVFWLAKYRTISNFKSSLIRILTLSCILFIISATGHSLGNGSDWSERLTSGISTIQELLKKGRSDFLLYPVVTLGGMFIPNFIFPGIQTNNHTDILLNVSFPALGIFLLFISVIKSNTANLTKRDIYTSLISAVIWIFIVFVVRKLNIATFSPSNLIITLTTGGLTIIIWVLLFLKYRFEKNILNALFISFSWSFLSFFLAWVWAPGSYIDSTHRYLTTSTVGISILLAVIISLGKNFKSRIYLTLLFSLILLVHIVSTRMYIYKMLNSHGQQISDKIWSSMPKIPQMGKNSLVFYFEGDNSNGATLGDSILFGFPFHMALIYNLKETDIMPVSMQDWKEVVSAVKDGQSFKAYGYPLKPIPINQVYAFHLQGQDNLIDITDTVRQKLSEIK